MAGGDNQRFGVAQSRRFADAVLHFARNHFYDLPMSNAYHRFTIIVSLAVLAWLAMMLLGGTGSALDAQLADWLREDRGTPLARNAIVFTQVGSGLFLVPVALLAALYLFFVRKRRAALFLVTVFVGRFLVELQKIVVARPRPDAPLHLVTVDTSAFPSGHAANAMITYLAIALLLPVRQRNRAIAVGIALALAIQAGASRVILGVHWPSDVIGGWAFGLLWVSLCLHLASSRPEAEESPPTR
jgi:undecaprenyl-diphosphatase